MRLPDRFESASSSTDENGKTHPATIKDMAGELGPHNVSVKVLLATYTLRDPELIARKYANNHSFDHFGRLLALTTPFVFQLKKHGYPITDDDLRIIQWFSVYHDSFYVSGNDLQHGQEAADYILGSPLSQVPVFLRLPVAQVIRQHVPDDPPEGLPLLSQICKDLDAVDRVRLTDPWKLDKRYLRLPISESFVSVAEELYQSHQKLLTGGGDPFSSALEAGKLTGILSD